MVSKIESIKTLSILILLTAIVLLLSACQSAPPKSTRADKSPGRSHNGVYGIKSDVSARTNLCKHPVKFTGRRYGHLSYKAKRRFMYDYVTGIRSQIRSRWLRPEGVDIGEKCTVQIRQRIDGCVKRVSFKDCRHFKMRTTVRRAVVKASPLPQAPHPALFSDDIVLTFKVR